MKNRIIPPIALVVLLVCSTVIGAEPIAIRVEIEPIRDEADNTVMSITVQVAPEDRSRVGTDAWIQGELRRRGDRIDRLARAVNFDDDGMATIEATWPPGDYELQIEVEGTKRRGVGVWIGRITVPDLSVAAKTPTPPPPPVPTPTPTPELPIPVPATEAAEAGSEPSTEDEPSSPGAAIAAGVAAGTGIVTGTTPDSVDRAPERDTAPTEPAGLDVEQEAEPDAAVAAAVAGAAVAAPEPTPEAVVQTPTPKALPEAEETPVDAVDDRSDMPAAAVAGASAASTPPQPVPTTVPQHEAPAARTATTSSWPDAEGTTDLTVMVTDKNRPITFLDHGSFALKVGGSEIPIDRVGDGRSTPLNLGFVVGVSAASDAALDELVRQLTAIALRANDTQDGLFLAIAGRQPPIVLPWGATAEQLSEAVAPSAGRGDANLSAALIEASRQFHHRTGRSFLIVISDGSDSSTKSGWKQATSSMASAGVPVFVIGLVDSGFPSRARSSLGKIADSTGGRSYFLGSAGMLELTLDYLGELIDGAYVLRFAEQPPGRSIRVQMENREWEVQHPGQTP